MHNDILILNMSDKERHIFSRNDRTYPELIAEVIFFLTNFQPDKYYFVFIVKPSATNYIDDFSEKFRTKIKNADVGFEPILEDESVIYE